MSIPSQATRGQFETSGPLASPYLSADIGAYITEVGGVDPTSIIRVDEDWKVHVNWILKGHLTEFVCGQFCISVYLESMGPGPELKVSELHIDLDPEPGDNEYAVWLTVPAGTISADDCSTPYKLVTTVTYLTPKSRPGPMAGFVEGPILQFYQP